MTFAIKMTDTVIKQSYRACAPPFLIAIKKRRYSFAKAEGKIPLAFNDNKTVWSPDLALLLKCPLHRFGSNSGLVNLEPGLSHTSGQSECSCNVCSLSSSKDRSNTCGLTGSPRTSLHSQSSSVPPGAQTAFAQEKHKPQSLPKATCHCAEK